MVIDHQNKLIFVHIYKTGGNTIRQAFDMNGRVEELGGVHCNAADGRQALLNARREKIWNEYTKFTVVRNPYDWNYSLYMYIKMSKGHNLHRAIQRMNFLQFLHYLTDTLFDMQRPFTSNKYSTQYDFLHLNGECLVDYILHTEDLKQGVDKMCTGIGIKAPEIKIINKNVHVKDRQTRSWLGDKERDYINQYFENDFLFTSE